MHKIKIWLSACFSGALSCRAAICKGILRISGRFHLHTDCSFVQTHHLAEKCLTFSAAQSLHLIAVYLEKEIPLIMYMEVQCLTEATSALEEYFEFLPEACNEILNLSVQASVWVCSDSQKDNGVASQTWPASSTRRSQMKLRSSSCYLLQEPSNNIKAVMCPN